jgi:hypothetical protein
MQTELYKKSNNNINKNPNLYELLSLYEGGNEITSLPWDIKSKSISKNLLKMINQKYQIDSKEPIYPLCFTNKKNNDLDEFLINSSDIENNSPVFSVILGIQKKINSEIKKENLISFNNIEEHNNSFNDSKNINKNESSRNIDNSFHCAKNNYHYNQINNISDNLKDLNRSMEFDLDKLNCINLNSQFCLK